MHTSWMAAWTAFGGLPELFDISITQLHPVQRVRLALRSESSCYSLCHLFICLCFYACDIYTTRLIYPWITICVSACISLCIVIPHTEYLNWKECRCSILNPRIKQSPSCSNVSRPCRMCTE